MHEANFTGRIVEAILGELKARPDVRARRVKVCVGEMLHLEPDSVRAHFEAMARGTPLDGVALDLEEVPVRLSCPACGWQGVAEDHHALFCSHCGSTTISVLSGRDIFIERIEGATRSGEAA